LKQNPYMGDVGKQHYAIRVNRRLVLSLTLVSSNSYTGGILILRLTLTEDTCIKH
jgi:hypothetical protein